MTDMANGKRLMRSMTIADYTTMKILYSEVFLIITPQKTPL
jgi:hypothetical protein